MLMTANPCADAERWENEMGRRSAAADEDRARAMQKLQRAAVFTTPTDWFHERTPGPLGLRHPRHILQHRRHRQARRLDHPRRSGRHPRHHHREGAGPGRARTRLLVPLCFPSRTAPLLRSLWDVRSAHQLGMPSGIRPDSGPTRHAAAISVFTDFANTGRSARPSMTP